MPSKVGRNISGQIGAKDRCNRRLKAATISEILHLFGQGNLTLSGKRQGILKTDVHGNHVFVIFACIAVRNISGFFLSVSGCRSCLGN